MDEASVTQRMRFVVRMNQHLDAEFPDFECLSESSEMFRVRPKGAGPATDNECLFRCQVKDVGILFSDWQIVFLFMCKCMVQGRPADRKVFGLRPSWSMHPSFWVAKEIQGVEYVDNMSEDECFQRILHYLEEHLLLAKPVHGLK